MEIAKAPAAGGRRQSIGGVNIHHHPGLPMRGTLRNMIKDADKDGDGKISMTELIDVMENALKTEESKRQYRRGIVALVLVVLVLIGSMGAMSAAVAIATPRACLVCSHLKGRPKNYGNCRQRESQSALFPPSSTLRLAGQSRRSNPQAV